MHTFPRRTLFGLVPLLLTETALAAETSRTLFIITRSTNANVVHYDARLHGARLDLATPVVAYWIMRAEDGRREPLTWLERRLAYGFDVIRHDARSADIRLHAFPSRRVQVRAIDGRFRAVTRIAGRHAELLRVFVQVKEGPFPGVEYLDVFGRGLSSGKLVRERLRG